MKKWFTSDWHLGEDRIGINGKPNLFYRPFKSVQEQNRTIIDNFLTSGFQDGDELWHLGDVVYEWNDEVDDYLSLARDEFPNSKFNLIVGNYDEGKLDILGKYFDTIQERTNVTLSMGKNAYLNHYPVKCKNRIDITQDIDEICITGHIHGLWKVQRKMINVGVDAWHFKPVSEDEIIFAMIACEKHYDNNVFPY